jgi:tetratricopeptide (TPR) repeat protein
MAYGNKALALVRQEDWDAALACYEKALQGFALCVQRGMYWLMPDLLKWLRYRLMTLLDLNRWQDATQDISRFLELYARFIENAEIHDRLKEKATNEFDKMIVSLSGLSDDERAEVYRRLSKEEADAIKRMIDEG